MGPQRAAALNKLGVASLEDLLLHLPLRYEDRTRLLSIPELRPGVKTAVAGTIVVAGLRRARRMALFEVRVEDAGGRLKALWFNQPYLADVLQKGKRVVLYGRVEPDAYGGQQLMMTSPEYEVLEDSEPAGIHTGRVVPVYPKLGPLSGKALRRVMLGAAERVPADLPDVLPALVRQRLGVGSRAEALRGVHIAEGDVERLNARRSPAHLRLILEECFLFQLGLARRRQSLRATRRRAAFRVNDRAREAVKRILPFHLTAAQRRALREIADDLGSPHPMNRLLQGDVGSGKTMVALLSMVVVLENAHQAAFMAPTEILAEQHYLSFKRLLARCPEYRVELLTASLKGPERRSVLERVASGAARIVVGTHALIQDRVRFERLGLAVVDEQHRFGVLQREDLIRKGYDVDVLVMTATPIPRTLALTAYGDLDVSVVDEKPPGRTPIATLVRPASARREIADRVRRELVRGRQVYVVYPLVEESEKLEDVAAATEMAEEWRRLLPGTTVGLLHGRLRGADKEAVMTAFARGELKVLVATTVIEVGVDVPAATLMVVEHAERFGLAQLHQLRGRVGRGADASTCLLVSHGRVSEEARARLEVMAATNDGFAIAERDLELRGPGDFFGTRQWGLPSFRVSQLIQDRELLEKARREAFQLVREHPTGALPAPLPAFLEGGGWERRFGLARVG